MIGFDRLELRFIGQIEPKGRERDPSLFSRPPIGTLVSAFDRRHRKPVESAAKRMLRRSDVSVITTRGGAGPNDSFRFARKLTLTSSSVDSLNSTLSTRRIQGFKLSKSSTPAGPLTATPRTPSSAACFAAASVPECQMELPRFNPRLIPDSTTSTFPQ